MLELNLNNVSKTTQAPMQTQVISPWEMWIFSCFHFLRICFRGMPQNPTGYKWMASVMAWCRQATSDSRDIVDPDLWHNIASVEHNELQSQPFAESHTGTVPNKDPISYALISMVFMIIHHNGVIMNSMASQIWSLTIVHSTVSSGADHRKHQSSALLAFVRGIHRSPLNSPHKGPVTRKMFPFDDVIICIAHAFS